MQNVKPGDLLIVDMPQGVRISYKVISRDIVDHRDLSVIKQEETLLTLITCFPFDAVVAGGPMRFVVQARPVATIDMANMANMAV